MVWTDDPKSDEVIERVRQARLQADDRRPQGRDHPAARPAADRRSARPCRSSHDGKTHKLALPLIGAYQAANVLVAAGLVLATGGDVRRGLLGHGRVSPVRGRLERAVISRGGAPVYVDYAHTADALEAAIAALRPHVEGPA